MQAQGLASGFHASVARFPDRPALFVDGQTYTYGELGDLVGRIARSIDTERDRVGVLANRSLSAYAGVLAALTSGRTYVPLHPEFPVERTRAMRRLSKVEVVIVGREAQGTLDELLPSLGEPLTLIFPELDEAPRYSGHRTMAADELDGAATPAQGVEDAYLLFTSGSTGEPKGVAVSHGNARAYVDYICDRYDVNQYDRFSQTFDLTFDLSVHDMFVCWDRGACLYSIPRSAAMAPTKFVRDHALTMWFSVPSTVGRMRSLRMLPPRCFPALRVALFCGEPLPAESAEAWAAAAPDSLVENLYGPTEATIAITSYRWGEHSAQECVNGIVPIGCAFEGQRACVVAADGREAGIGEEGELCLAGSQVTAGYLNNPEKTASHFVRLPLDPHVTWYRTGDLARRNAAGCLFYLGRRDHQIKVRGFRVELQEIEHVLREAAGGGTAVAVPWPVKHGSAEGIVGFLARTANVATEPLLARCRATLPDYMVPNTIRFLQDIPLTANGKIDRYQLIRQLEED